MTEKRNVYKTNSALLAHVGTDLCSGGRSLIRGRLSFLWAVVFGTEHFGRPPRWKRLITGTSLLHGHQMPEYITGCSADFTLQDEFGINGGQTANEYKGH